MLDADKVTRPSGSQLFYDTAGSTDKTLKLYEGHAHDLLNDLDREVVMADIRGGSRRGSPPRRSSGPAPGLLTFGLPRQLLKELYATWPGAGFHKRLFQLSLKRLRTHPWSPLPMMRL